MSRAYALSMVAFLIVLPGTQTGCIRASSGEKPRPIEIWTLPSPLIAGADSGIVGSLVEIDSVSLRPVVSRAGVGYGEGQTSDTIWYSIHAVIAAVVTTYQGGRYHPETVRALANDSVVLADFAARVVHVARDNRVILDFQSSTPEDLPEVAAVARAVGRIARTEGRRSLSIIVPAQDTVAYPTDVLSRVADWLIIRLDGEHRPGTPPGPAATPEFVARAIGMRAKLIGASRIGVEIPLFGYVWDRAGNAAPITFRDAQALVLRESGVLTRDPPSQFLTATGRDGWTLWVPDARAVQLIVREAKRRGVTSFHLAGPQGADPEIFLQRSRLLQ